MSEFNVVTETFQNSKVVTFTNGAKYAALGKIAIVFCSITESNWKGGIIIHSHATRLHCDNTLQTPLY